MSLKTRKHMPCTEIVLLASHMRRNPQIRYIHLKLHRTFYLHTWLRKNSRYRQFPTGRCILLPRLCSNTSKLSWPNKPPWTTMILQMTLRRCIKLRKTHYGSRLLDSFAATSNNSWSKTPLSMARSMRTKIVVPYATWKSWRSRLSYNSLSVRNLRSSYW